MNQESSLQTDGEGFTTKQVLQLTKTAIVAAAEAASAWPKSRLGGRNVPGDRLYADS